MGHRLGVAFNRLRAQLDGGETLDSNVEMGETVTALMLAVWHVNDWLEKDDDIPATVKAKLRDVRMIAPLGICNAYANTAKHRTLNDPTRTAARVHEFSTNGPTMTIRYGPGDVAEDSWQTIDALDLAEQCDRAWREWLAKHRVPVPGGAGRSAAGDEASASTVIRWTHGPARQAGSHSSTRLPSGSVTQPNRPTPSMSCVSFGHVRSLGAQLREHRIQVADPEVEHGLLGTGTEVVGFGLERREHRRPGSLTPQAVLVGVQAQALAIPGAQGRRVGAPQEVSTDSEHTFHAAILPGRIPYRWRNWSGEPPGTRSAGKIFATLAAVSATNTPVASAVNRPSAETRADTNSLRPSLRSTRASTVSGTSSGVGAR